MEELLQELTVDAFVPLLTEGKTQQLQQENGLGSLMKGDIQRLAQLTKTETVKGKTDLLKHNVVGKTKRVGRNGRKGHPVYYLQAQKTSKEKQFH